MLEKLIGFDTELGMSFCLDDEDCYREILEEYVNSNSYSELNSLYDNKDWTNYRIKIHAVKSTSKTIGAVELSDMALALEEACKNQDEDYIIASHSRCMEQYEIVLNTIKKALE